MTCQPVDGILNLGYKKFLPDGTTCLGGLCKGGVCELATPDLASRLFRLFADISIDKISECRPLPSTCVTILTHHMPVPDHPCVYIHDIIIIFRFNVGSSVHARKHRWQLLDLHHSLVDSSLSLHPLLHCEYSIIH